MKEQLNIINDHMEVIAVKDRNEAHRKGLLHETVHVWFYVRHAGEIFLLFQQRSFKKTDFAGLYDITVAGHIDASETRDEAVLREIEEEIGLKLSLEQLDYSGHVPSYYEEPGFIDHELCAIYFTEFKWNQMLKLGPEVERLIVLNEREMEAWRNNQISSGYELGRRSKNTFPIEPSEFCPHTGNYRDFVVNYIAGKK
ncbi:hydrolase [Listeria floridensis FSL S10-1187]|uniref:Hydrolase n=1 Tax=Listeria floridensis FSL S10-1187 TaxID=1265817 RepID=A0ABP3B057_9LIST|nr:NUDIX domain-containing protein [Listeria floridensis]EUJ33221.1 hydrolase [Listeria floridensis FSL S10-1187]